MNNSANQPHNPTNPLTNQAKNSLWSAILLITVTIPATLFYLYFYFVTGHWQLLAATGAVVIALIAGCLHGWLTRQGKPALGAQISVYGVGLSFFTFAVFIADLGLVLALTVMIVASIIASLTLSAKQATWAVITSGILVFAIILLDFAQLPFRIAVAQFQYLTPVGLGVMVLAYGAFLFRQFKHYRLRTKLIIAFIAVTLISIGAVAYITHQATDAALTRAANQRLLAAAQQSAQTIDAFIRDNLESVRTEAELPALSEYLLLTPEQRTRESLLRQEVIAILRSLQRRDLVFISSYALLDIEGQNILDTSTRLIGVNESGRDYFDIPVNTGLSSYVSPVEFDPETGEASLYFSSPVLDPSRNVIGLLRVRYQAKVLQQFIETGSSAEENIFGVLFDENQLHLAHSTEPAALFKLVGSPDPQLVAQLQAERRLPPGSAVKDHFTNLPDLGEKLITAPTQPFFTAKDVATGDKINQVAAATVNSQPWLVTFFQPQEVFLTPVDEQTRRTLLLTAGILTAAAAVAVVLGQRLANPIVNLTKMAQQVAAGNLEAQAVADTQDETGQLAQAFNSMTTRLRTLIGSLEEQVKARTAELAISIEVGQKAAAIRNLDELLPTITEFIRERFELYYAHVYFVDDLGQNLVLKSGTGEVGKQLLARRHTLPVGPGSIVGRVAALAQSIVVPDTENSDIHMPNPLLPRTRSEVAVPLMVEGRVIGVLDMQATRVNTFTAQNLTVFEAMATHLAISIDSAQQWAAAQEAQRKTEAALRQLTHQAWSETLSSKKQRLNFVYDLTQVSAAEPNRLNKTQNGALSVPVLVQNQPVGQLSVQVPPDKNWTEEEQLFLETVAQQLAQKAENLRLFEGTQKQAAREQLTRQITDKIRASRNIEAALRTAAEELSKVLGTASAAIDLKIAPKENGSE